MKFSERGALAAAIIGSATVFLDGAIVNLALPRIGASLPAVAIGVLEGQVYIVAGYMATLAAFLMLAGALGDQYGRRRIFLVGLLGFGLTSLVCGLAPSLDFLAGARLIQGVAGALLVPGSLAIITTTFDGPARSRAVGVWAASTSVVAVLGPPIGGSLIELLGWQSIFLVNLPLIAVGVVLTIRFVPAPPVDRVRARFDLPGALVAALAVGGLSFGAIRGQQVSWSEAGPLVILGVGVVALIAFPILMIRRRDPLVPPDLFRNRAFTTINIATVLVYAGLYVMLYIQSLFLQGVLGYTPLAAALITLPTGLAIVFLSTWAGTLAGRYGARRFLVGGPLLMTAGTLWWLRVPSDSTPWVALLSSPESLVPPATALIDPLPAIGLFGVGIALVVAPLTATLLDSVPVARAGVASAVNNALSRVGQPLASAAIFILITDRFYASLSSRVPGVDPRSADLRAAVQPLNSPAASVGLALEQAARLASTESFHVAILVVTGLLLVGALTCWLGLRRTESSAPT